MNNPKILAAPSTLYYRLIAIWVICEAMLGGIIHGFRIPVSGLVVGSCAVICICLIAWYVPQKGAIIKATIVVAVFKMMLSPQAPPTAYIAVFFQGLLGELLFNQRKFFRLSCMLLAVLALLESGLQRILVLTIVYGNDLWKVINDFINGLTKQKQTTNYSLWIGSIYVFLHLVTGLVVGWWASILPKKIAAWREDEGTGLIPPTATSFTPIAVNKRKRRRMGIFIIWILLTGLYIQSYYRIGTPLLPYHTSMKILLRSLIIIIGWIVIVGPLLTQILHRWLEKRKDRSKTEVAAVLELLPSTKALLAQCWKQSSGQKGLKRFRSFLQSSLVNTLSPETALKGTGIYILTAPIGSGKTSSLLNWSSGRTDVFGILTPVVNGKRIFMNVATSEQFEMEAGAGEPALLVGRYLFSKKSFEKAISIIKEAAPQQGWLIIDEIGPMELRGEGFYDVLAEVLKMRKQKIIIVARKGLVNDVKEKFGIGDARELNGLEGLEQW
jgi:nucleoside-triphosphatase THEP1/ABC-type thiamin/hydroxymethylpyrimidine transport system permease subunit